MITVVQYEVRAKKLKADVPQLEAIISKQWGKEDELKKLKSDLAVLDRKITAKLAPKHEETDGVEVRQSDTQRVEVCEKTQTEGSKESMVAEPIKGYSHRNFVHL